MNEEKKSLVDIVSEKITRDNEKKEEVPVENKFTDTLRPVTESDRESAIVSDIKRAEATPGQSASDMEEYIKHMGIKSSCSTIVEEGTTTVTGSSIEFPGATPLGTVDPNPKRVSSADLDKILKDLSDKYRVDGSVENNLDTLKTNHKYDFEWRKIFIDYVLYLIDSNSETFDKFGINVENPDVLEKFFVVYRVWERELLTNR